MFQFSLLTLNTFGLPWLAAQRLPRLVRELRRHSSAVICLQEIHQNAYLPVLKRELSGYPHFIFQPNRLAPKGGLLTASRVALEDNSFFPYQHRGRWMSTAFGDRFLHKGLLSTTLRMGGHSVVVANTHLNANYFADWSPTNRAALIQHGQVRQLADWVCAQPDDVLVVVCGDFNFPRGSYLYEELLVSSGLTDPLAHDPRPTYRPFPLVPSKWALPIDFVFLRVPPSLNVTVRADIRTIEDSGAPSGWRRFLTDHCALTLDLTWKDGAQRAQEAARALS
jgi:endonuclease/exonuclease/phosphatase family metal-dependent hydrolase